MQVDHITVELKRTIQTQPYESITFAVRLGAAVLEGEDLDQCMRQLWAMAEQNIRAQRGALTKEHAERARQLWLGLPEDERAKLPLDERRRVQALIDEDDRDGMPLNTLASHP